ncbi:hypothetical protein CDD83_837 [Cordyceps sp. RAO-2017]|nr:hypothetical protein CDD83_837 [Cordyceps sp. RAO-2017]
MVFSLKLGIDAQIRYRADFETDLLRVGLPGLSYGAVTIGPQVSVGARAGFEAAARGRLLAGAEMGLHDAHVVVDLVDPSQNARSGWEPYFKPVLEAEGELMLAASLGLPVGLECGIQFSSWHKTVAIINEPSIQGTAQVAASIGLDQAGVFAAGFVDRDGCTGISTRLSWRNKLFVNVMDWKEFSLFDTGDRALLRGCIPIPYRYEKKLWNGAKAAKTINATTAQHRKREEPALLPAAPVRDVTSRAARRGSRVVSTAIQPFLDLPYNDADGFRHDRLVTADDSAMVLSCSNGNLYVVKTGGLDNRDCSELFPAARDHTIVYDGTQRLMHYYGNTLAAAGVSRLRLQPGYEVPRTAAPVVLGLYTSPADPERSFYLAVDPDGRVLYPIVCDYADGAGPKVFLASDPAEGLKTLESPDVRYSITGGAVSGCYHLQLSGEAYMKRHLEGYLRHGNTTGASR